MNKLFYARVQLVLHNGEKQFFNVANIERWGNVGGGGSVIFLNSGGSVAVKEDEGRVDDLIQGVLKEIFVD